MRINPISNIRFGLLLASAAFPFSAFTAEVDLDPQSAAQSLAIRNFRLGYAKHDLYGGCNDCQANSR